MLLRFNISLARLRWFIAPVLAASCMMMVCPKLGASLRRVLVFIMVSNTMDWKCVFTSSTTCFDILVLLSNMVRSIPSMSRFGLNRDCTILMVFNSLPRPSNAKYWHCTGIITESAAVSELTVMSPREGEQSMMMKSYSSLIGARQLRIICSRCGMLMISISAPTRSMCAGSRYRFGVSVSLMMSRGLMPSMMHSYMLASMSFGLKPTPDVELACGSASMSKVLCSNTARLAARFIEVVVLPTPPF